METEDKDLLKKKLDIIFFLQMASMFFFLIGFFIASVVPSSETSHVISYIYKPMVFASIASFTFAGILVLLKVTGEEEDMGSWLFKVLSYAGVFFLSPCLLGGAADILKFTGCIEPAEYLAKNQLWVLPVFPIIVLGALFLITIREHLKVRKIA